MLSAGARNMAAANCSAVALFENLRRNTVASSSSSTSVSFPLNSGRRRNHLRPKILKTLTKPQPTPTHIPSPPAPLDRLDSNEEVVMTGEVEVSVDQVFIEDEGSEGVERDVEVLRSEIGSEMVGVDRFVGKLDMKVVGMYGLGLFVLQAVCGLLIFGSAGVSRDDENDEYKCGSGDEKEKIVLEDDVRIRRIVAHASEVVNVDESVLEERIREIRALARNAREREAKEARGKSNVEGLGEDDGVGIEKEVSTRLVRLQKKLGSVSDKSSMSVVNSLSKVPKGSEISKEVNGKLVFPKKQTFRNSITTKPLNDAKGFSNVTDHTNSQVDKQEVVIDPSNSAHLTSPQVADGNTSINGSRLKDNFDKKLVRKKALELKRRRGSKQKESTIVETNAGDVQGISNGMHMGASNTSTIMGASQQEIAISDTDGALSLNGSSKNGNKNTTAARMGREKESDNEAGLWWLHLTYVFAILMRQGSGPGGLYTLKATTKALEKKDEAYTVAFEDRGDANNFCYIVESFFEEMADFTADIVPLPTKEMRQPVESGVLHVIIVKKGQLELYAGQALSEVETRLRSLLE